jgi:IKI3 family
MIISASQKDPAEHLEELQTFMAAPAGPLRRFAIDKRLGRHARALDALVGAGPEMAGDARAYAKQHGLLRVLVSRLDGQPELRATAMADYAQVRRSVFVHLAHPTVN